MFSSISPFCWQPPANGRDVLALRAGLMSVIFLSLTSAAVRAQEPVVQPDSTSEGVRSIIEKAADDRSTSDALPPPVLNPPQLSQSTSQVATYGQSILPRDATATEDLATEHLATDRAATEQRPSSPPPTPRPILPNDLSEVPEIAELVEPSIIQESVRQSDSGEYELLEQGPVHEAFAIPDDSDILSAKQMVIAPRSPPPSISEIPPESAELISNGNDVQWIHGYWYWDSDRADFIWISGFYRDVPPGRTWIRGEWIEQPNGTFAWYRGYWGDRATESKHLPEPPPTVRIDPSSDAPNDNSFWMPGEWQYHGNQFVWHAGYWTEQYEDWIWQPSCYVETAQGHVYVSGYWDYEPAYRGALYTPVRFHSPYRTGRIVYTPRQTFCSNPTLLVQLFVRTGRYHFYLGDYYGANFTTRGYRPWYSLSRTHYHSPSVLSYYQWKYRRSGLSFADSMLRYQSYFAQSKSPRPRTITASSLDVIVRSSVGGIAAPQSNGRNLSSTVTAAVTGLSSPAVRSDKKKDLFETKSLFSGANTLSGMNKRPAAGKSANSASARQAIDLPRSSGSSISLEQLFRSAATGSTSPLSRTQQNPFNRSSRESVSTDSRAMSSSGFGQSSRSSASRSRSSQSTGPRRAESRLSTAQPGSLSSRSTYFENRVTFGSSFDRTNAGRTIDSPNGLASSNSNRRYQSSNDRNTNNSRNSISSRSMFPQGQQRVIVVPPANYGTKKSQIGSTNRAGSGYAGKPNGRISNPPSLVPSNMRTNSRAGVPTSRDNVVNSRRGVVSSRGIPMSSSPVGGLRTESRSRTGRPSSSFQKSTFGGAPSMRSGGQPRSMSRAIDSSRTMNTRGSRR